MRIAYSMWYSACLAHATCSPCPVSMTSRTSSPPPPPPSPLLLPSSFYPTLCLAPLITSSCLSSSSLILQRASLPPHLVPLQRVLNGHLVAAAQLAYPGVEQVVLDAVLEQVARQGVAGHALVDVHCLLVADGGRQGEGRGGHTAQGRQGGGEWRG